MTFADDVGEDIGDIVGGLMESWPIFSFSHGWMAGQQKLYGRTGIKKPWLEHSQPVWTARGCRHGGFSASWSHGESDQPG